MESRESSETIRRTRTSSGMIWSDLHGDMQSAAEMTAPPLSSGVTEMNGPKVQREPALSAMAATALGYMLGTLEYPAVLEA